jgi:hypothetical protein
MFDCGQNIKVAYGQLPANLWAYAVLISRLEDMDFDEMVPDESELSTRLRYRDMYLKYVEHFRKIARDIIETKGKEVPVFPEPEDSDEVTEDTFDEETDLPLEIERKEITFENKDKPKKRGRPKGSKNKTNGKLGRPKGAKNKSKGKKKPGRPKGSKNQTKPKKKPGRPKGSKNKPKN